MVSTSAVPDCPEMPSERLLSRGLTETDLPASAFAQVGRRKFTDTHLTSVAAYCPLNQSASSNKDCPPNRKPDSTTGHSFLKSVVYNHFYLLPSESSAYPNSVFFLVKQDASALAGAFCHQGGGNGFSIYGVTGIFRIGYHGQQLIVGGKCEVSLVRSLQDNQFFSAAEGMSLAV